MEAPRKEEVWASSIKQVVTGAVPDDNTLAIAWFFAQNAKVAELKALKSMAAPLQSAQGQHASNIAKVPEVGEGSKKRRKRGKISACSHIASV